MKRQTLSVFCLFLTALLGLVAFLLFERTGDSPMPLRQTSEAEHPDETRGHSQSPSIAAAAAGGDAEVADEPSKAPSPFVEDIPRRLPAKTLNRRQTPDGHTNSTTSTVQKSIRQLKGQIAATKKHADILSLFDLNVAERKTLTSLLQQRGQAERIGTMFRMKDMSVALTNFLGEEDYQRLLKYDAATFERQHVEAFENSLGKTLSLSRSQRDGLQSLFGNLRKSQEAHYLVLGAEGAEARLDELAEQYTNLAGQAEFLEPAQQELLVDHLENHLAYMELTETLIADRFEQLKEDRVLVYHPDPDSPFTGMITEAKYVERDGLFWTRSAGTPRTTGKPLPKPMAR